MDNRGEMTVGSFIIGALLLIALAIGIGDLLSIANSQMNTPGFQSNLSRFQAEQGYMENIVGNVTEATFSERQFENAGQFTEGGFTALSTTKRSVNSWKSFVQAAQEDIFLPTWLTVLLMSMLTLTFTLLVLSAVFRWRLI